MSKKLPRIIHKAYAWLFAYFWKPCPICGRMFGGHEEPIGFLYTGPNRLVVTCSLCVDRADERNKANNYTPVIWNI